MQRIMLAAEVLGLVVGAAGWARADLITNHAATGVQVSAGYPAIGGSDNEQGVYSSSSLVGPVTKTDSAGTVTASGTATSGGVVGGSYDASDFRLTSLAQISVTGNGEGGAFGGAFWRDILFLGSTNPALVGSTLRINVEATGELGYTGLSSNGGPATSVSITGYNGSGQYSSAVGASLSASGVLSQGSGWDSFSSNPLSGGHIGYTGTFYLDIPIVQGGGYVGAIPGSIWFQITDDSSAGGQFPFSYYPTDSLYAADPLSIVSFTLPDVGNVTPESLGVSLTFDSGLLSPNVQSIPEPSSLTLSLIAMVGLLVYAWRRRSLSVAKC